MDLAGGCFSGYFLDLVYLLLQVPVIPVSHIQVQDPRSQYFRPVSPLGHIYMEIDPVYARLDPDREAPDLQLSDVSDDDLRRSSDISRQSSNRYAEERPLILSSG